MRYLIETVKRGQTASPDELIPAGTVVSVKYKDGWHERWLNLVDTCGRIMFIESFEEIFDKLCGVDYEDADFMYYVSQHTIFSLEGIDLGNGTYEELFAGIHAHEDMAEARLLQFLADLAHADEDSAAALAEAQTGKHIDE